MKKYVFGFNILGLFLIIGCSGGSNQRESINTSDLSMDNQETPVLTDSIQFRRTKAAKERDTISFELDNPAFVSMLLKMPNNTGNLRINQLLMPDGTSDGPFGKEINENLIAPGTYQVIIGESLMQGSTYAGEYILELRVK